MENNIKKNPLSFQIDPKPETPEAYEEKLKEFAVLARSFAENN